MGFGPSDLAGAVGRFAHLTPPVGCHNALIGARPEAIADGRHEQAAVVRGSDRLVIIGGVAAIIGGLCWAVKAAALITTRMQPPVIYDVAPLFFPVAVVGLSALLLDRRARMARGGSVSACVAELAAVVSVLGLFLGPVDWTPTSSVGSRPVTILTPFITLAAYGALLGLFLIGTAIRRTAPCPAGGPRSSCSWRQQPSR